jgi:saccharopine dehydrogenase-like NADP-dependent oxidoreductase
MKHVLVLGAGLVARPMVRYLLENTDHRVTVASRTVAKATALIDGHPRGNAVTALADDLEVIERLVQDSDLVVSLLPYIHHVAVAKLCLQYGKHLVTTSYVSPAMRELDAEATAKGLLFLNEIGLDPGIDHMSAMRIIHEVQGKGGKIVSFKSYCGGLPAPEANDNPFGFKMSWSPRGVAMAGRNEARFKSGGQEKVIPGPLLFSHAEPFVVPSEGTFDSYPNRNSLPYIDIYGIPEARTMVRGTLRNPGWCRAWQAIADVGYLSDDPLPAAGLTFKALTAKLIGSAGADLRAEVAAKSQAGSEAETLDRLEWLGLFSDAVIPASAKSPLDALCAPLTDKLSYQPGERDMIVLFTELVAEYPDGTEQTITSTFVDFGIPDGDSSMARTVSLPAAIAVKMILDGSMKATGVKIPIEPAVYNPVLDELEALGLACKDVYGDKRPVSVLA